MHLFLRFITFQPNDDQWDVVWCTHIDCIFLLEKARRCLKCALNIVERIKYTYILILTLCQVFLYLSPTSGTKYQSLWYDMTLQEFDPPSPDKRVQTCYRRITLLA